MLVRISTIAANAERQDPLGYSVNQILRFGNWINIEIHSFGYILLTMTGKRNILKATRISISGVSFQSKRLLNSGYSKCIRYVLTQYSKDPFDCFDLIFEACSLQKVCLVNATRIMAFWSAVLLMAPVGNVFSDDGCSGGVMIWILAHISCCVTPSRHIEGGFTRRFVDALPCNVLSIEFKFIRYTIWSRQITRNIPFSQRMSTSGRPSHSLERRSW